jgi:hypothetical protein
MRATRVWTVATLALGMFGGEAPVASAASQANNQCTVTVDRSMASDTFEVTRQKLENGDCVCYISTGPASQSAAVEKSIVDIQASHDCARKKYPIGALVGAGALAGGIAAVVSSDGGGSGSGGGTGGANVDPHNDSPGG